MGNAVETSEEEAPVSPEQWAKHWGTEFTAAKKSVEKWHDQGAKILRRFRDERTVTDGPIQSVETHWNLFSANIQTQRAIMYGQTPRASVTRKHADASDDVARVAAEMLERVLNGDIERSCDSFALALQYALDDRLLVGMGMVKQRYCCDVETQTTPAVTGPHPDPEQAARGVTVERAPAVTQDVKTREDVEADYIHWRDVLWSPARVFHEVRWVAFRAQMSREQLEERFGEELADDLPMNAKHRDEGAANEDSETPWDRCDVWEVWSKEHRKVFWYVNNYRQILDSKDDPLGLEGFWPFPRPMVANVTTDSFMPRPDYALAQDLYEEIDTVSTRITVLERSIRVVGVYNKGNPEIARILKELGDNEMIAADDWNAFAEKGGLKGAIDWFPLEQVTAALTMLRDYRRELIDALYQITGMSDILRGQASAGGVTATEQAIKARFGSVRMQALQDEFARFASDLQRIKAEIIAKHYDAKTILERSNIQYTADAQLAEQAVQLVKSRASAYRVEVKPEAISLTDFAALKDERTELLGAFAGYLQTVGPLIQQMPQATPFLLQILQWSVAGMRGASTIEGVLDQAIAQAIAAQKQAAMAPQAPQQPDPKLMAVQAKGQLDLQREQFKAQADMARIQAETEATAQRERIQREENVREQAQKNLINAAMKSQSGPFGGAP